MNRELRRAIAEDEEFIQRADALAEMFERADEKALTNALSDKDDEAIALALGVSLDKANQMAIFFHERAVKLTQPFLETSSF